jgi:DNA-directed RNA polymerase subunit H (RpoH/RPB5)
MNAHGGKTSAMAVIAASIDMAAATARVQSWSDMKLRIEGDHLRRLVEHGDPIAAAMLAVIGDETHRRLHEEPRSAAADLGVLDTCRIGDVVHVLRQSPAGGPRWDRWS